MGETVRLYMLPDSVYWRSSTRLGTLYTWERQRWSWADVATAVLDRGAEVVIQGAPVQLVNWAEKQIAAMRD